MTDEQYSIATDLKVEMDYLERMIWLIENATNFGCSLVAYRKSDEAHINEENLHPEIAKEFEKILQDRLSKARDEFLKI